MHWALVKYVPETGDGPSCALRQRPSEGAPHRSGLSRMVASDDVVIRFDKKKAAPGRPWATRCRSELSRFLTLLNRNGRMDLVQDILRDFVDMYRRSIGMCKRSVTVAEPSERLSCSA